jgi:DNA-binding transcriptional MerR regulator
MNTVALDSQAHNAAASRNKLFYRIQEVAKMTGLKPYVLRYWESEFKELAPDKDASEQRRYRQSDVEVILAIRKLLYEDRFTIQGARKRLRAELAKMRDGAAAEQPERNAEATAAPLAPRAAESTGNPVDHALRHLRREVNDLIDMLSH